MTDKYDLAIDYAAKLGTEHGKAAASWSYDGNTPRTWYESTLRMIEDGDPELYDRIPAPDLSGQWADRMTGPELYSDALEESDIEEDDDTFDALFTEICDAYEAAFSQAIVDEIERACRYQLS